jgi:glycosyltransferase involved in cell wall biosynthesis
VVLFAGALNAYRNLESLLAGLRRLLAAEPDAPITLRVRTPLDRAGRYLSGVGDLIRARALEIVDFLPHRRSLEEAARADVLLHVLSDCLPDEEHVPGKLFEYLALGRPILFLTSVEGENARILAGAGGAVVCDVDDPPAIAAGLGGLLDRWRRRALDPVPREVDGYARAVLAARLAKALDPLVSSSPAARPAPNAKETSPERV